MKLFFTTTVLAIAAVLALASSAQAAGMANDLNPERRAKIAKAKAKMASEQADSFDFLSSGNGQKKVECGSQQIGNVNLNRQAGTGPREIFVFAPDAINIVGPRGCQ
jgi:ABC-type taurine transport system substrate-binding protein